MASARDTIGAAPPKPSLPQSPRGAPLAASANIAPGVRFLASFARVLSACVPCPQNVTFGPAFGPLTQHFHISTINAAAFTKQRKPTLLDQRRQVMYGQELNPESYAICKADMLIKGQDIANIIFGNTLSADGLPGKHFDYMLSNPPFGVEWKKIDFWIAGRIDRRTVGQIAAQFVLPGVSDAATGRCRGEPLLPSAECLPLTELRNLEPIPDRTPNRFLANGWRCE